MRYARRRCSGQELIKKWLARREITALRERQEGKSHTTHITLGPLGARTLISCLRNKIIQQKSRIVNMKTRNYSSPGFYFKIPPDLLMEEVSYSRVRIWKIADPIWMWFSSFVFRPTQRKRDISNSGVILNSEELLSRRIHSRNSSLLRYILVLFFLSVSFPLSQITLLFLGSQLFTARSALWVFGCVVGPSGFTTDDHIFEWES